MTLKGSNYHLMTTREMNPVRDQNYFALDLELNNLKNGEQPRIIEVGICIGSPLRPNDLIVKNWYLDPEESITPFITSLTGITDEVIAEKAVPHTSVATQLGDLINEYKCFTNPITWGQGDADELQAEFKERGINFPHFGRRIFDVKTIYVFRQMVYGRAVSGGLKKAMQSYGLNFIGEQHRASVDAENTLRLFFHLLQRERSVVDCIQGLSALA